MLRIGVDIEDISRFIDKDEKFYQRIFTQAEIDYCRKNKNSPAHFAARFCAKEAVIKALSNKSIPYREIEILNYPNGAPYIKYKDYNFSLSLSHEKDKAIAFVVLS